MSLDGGYTLMTCSKKQGILGRMIRLFRIFRFCTIVKADIKKQKTIRQTNQTSFPTRLKSTGAIGTERKL